MSFFGVSRSAGACAPTRIEQGAKVDHRLPKVLGARFAAAVANRDVVSFVIMLDDQRVVD